MKIQPKYKTILYRSFEIVTCIAENVIDVPQDFTIEFEVPMDLFVSEFINFSINNTKIICSIPMFFNTSTREFEIDYRKLLINLYCKYDIGDKFVGSLLNTIDSLHAYTLESIRGYKRPSIQEIEAGDLL